MLALAVLAGCGGRHEGEALPLVGVEPVHPSVVAHVALRDGVDETTARARVLETLRLVAAARAEREDAEPDPSRASHLRRTALARLVLQEEFEAEHRAVDIPDDDPLLVRARAPGRFVHPRLHDVCQVIAMPQGVAPEDVATHTADPAWRARAEARLAPAARHLREVIATDDPHACDLIARDLPLEVREADGIELKYERARFDLDACASPREADGSCSKPRFAPEWVAAVREGPVPGWRGPFTTQFGLHLALVQEVLPSFLPGDDDFEATVRAGIHREWQAAELVRWLAALRTEYAAQTIVAAEDAPR